MSIFKKARELNREINGCKNRTKLIGLVVTKFTLLCATKSLQIYLGYEFDK